MTANGVGASRVGLASSPVALRMALHHARPASDHEPAGGLLLDPNSNAAPYFIAALATAVSVTAAIAMVGGEQSTKRADIDWVDR